MGFAAVFMIFLMIIVGIIFEIQNKIEAWEYKKDKENREKQEQKNNPVAQKNNLVAQKNNTVAEKNNTVAEKYPIMISVNGVITEYLKIPYGRYRVIDKFGMVKQNSIHVNGSLESVNNLKPITTYGSTQGWILQSLPEQKNNPVSIGFKIKSIISVDGIMTDISEVLVGHYRVVDQYGTVKAAVIHVDKSLTSENRLRAIATSDWVLQSLPAAIKKSIE